jgi:glycine/D-amino acid oxidase-like deaminating enzyme
LQTGASGGDAQKGFTAQKPEVYRNAGERTEASSTSGSTSEDSISSISNSSVMPPVWLCVGLGARGLVYHAWLGQLVAKGILDDTEKHIPPELLAWRKSVLDKIC